MSEPNTQHPDEIVTDTGEPAAEEEQTPVDYDDLELPPTKPSIRLNSLAMERAWD